MLQVIANSSWNSISPERVSEVVLFVFNDKYHLCVDDDGNKDKAPEDRTYTLLTPEKSKATGTRTIYKSTELVVKASCENK
jgi:hypothetical protein